MKKIYETSELLFSIFCIIVYSAIMSLGYELSGRFGRPMLFNLGFCILFSAVLLVFLRKNGLTEKYGLKSPGLKMGKLLFYLPLLILISKNLWFGVHWNLSPFDTAVYMGEMLLVGFLEELIFRGFLFRAIEKSGLMEAVIISSVTFGLGHIMLLFTSSGAELFPNLLQVVGAIAVGFLFVVLFLKTGSLYPAMLTHALIDALSAFANEPAVTPERRIMSLIVTIVVSGLYTFYLSRIKQSSDGEYPA